MAHVLRRPCSPNVLGGNEEYYFRQPTHYMSFPRSLTTKQAFLLSCCLVVLYVLLIMAASGKLPDFLSAYRSLFQWDGHFYASIVHEGYFVRKMDWPIIGNPTQDRTNVAFFPAYPFFSIFVSLIFFLPTDIALILTSQIACVLLITYTILLLQKFGLSAAGALFGAVALICFPGAFFLIASLPESLLLAGAAGYLYWSLHERPSFLLSAGHGIVLTATKILGAPVVLLPVINALVRRERKDVIRQTLSAGFALLGLTGFLLFCQWVFGHWNLYFAVQKAGWNVEPAYVFFLHPEILKTILFPWTIHWPTYTDFTGTVITNTLNRESYYAVSCIAWWVLLWPCLEWITGSLLRIVTWRRRAAYYVGTALLWYVIVVSTWNSGMQSAFRYSLLPFFLMLLTVAHRSATLPSRNIRFSLTGILCVLLLSGIILQYGLAVSFTHGGWVG